MNQGRLLVLDDDLTVGTLLVIVAESAGFEAQLCEQPQVFLDAVKTWAPTHVAIDLKMPQMNGSQVLQALAAAQSQARVIICSGAGSADTQDALDEARRLGLHTVGALPKPFSLSSLRALLASA